MCDSHERRLAGDRAVAAQPGAAQRPGLVLGSRRCADAGLHLRSVRGRALRQEPGARTKLDVQLSLERVADFLGEREGKPAADRGARRGEVRSGDARRRLPPGESVTIRSGQIESAPYDEDALHASTWI